ncbi:MAG: hypothetical protein ACI4RA_02295 [Kiritimatiellia bacterium]
MKRRAAIASTFGGVSFGRWGLVLAGCLLAGGVAAEAPQLGDDFAPTITNRNRLVFWVDANVNCLDANTNLVTDANGKVVQWADVREVFNDAAPEEGAEAPLHVFSYKRGIVRLLPEGETGYGGTPPTFKTDERHPGMRFLDFGDYGSGRWMYLANGNGDLVHQRVGTFYCVVGFDTPNNCGHILSNINTLDTQGNVGVFFHKGSGQSPEGAISTGQTESSMYKGASYLDGVRIDPRTTQYKWDRYQMFGQVGPYVVRRDGSTLTPSFSTLLNDRNVGLSKEFGGCGYRYGGAVIGELLVWDVVLTEAERRHVEAYLRAKWFGIKTEPETAIAAGDELVVDAGATEAFAASATGEGTLVKRGAGTLTVQRHLGDADAAIRLEEGAVRVAGGRVDNLPFDPLPGTKVTLDAEGHAVVSVPEAPDGSAAFVGAQGRGVTVRARDLGSKSIVAADARLRIVSADADDFEAPALAERWPNLLQNASFEEPVLKAGGWEQPKAPWIGNGVSVEVATWGAWFGDPGETGADTSKLSIPDGRQFLAIQARAPNLGVVSQTFEAPIDGLYRLTFWMARRTNRTEPANSVIPLFSVDGTNFYHNVVASDYRGSRNEFKLYSAYLPPLKKGPHTLTLSLDDSTATIDRAVVLDDLRLTPVAAGDFVYVPNAGMDSNGAKPIEAQADNSGYRKEGAPEGWTFSIAEGKEKGYAGLTQFSSYWNWLDSRENPVLCDYRKAYLQYDGQIETTVTLPRAGRVRLSFTYANRSNRDFPKTSGPARPTGHRVEASLYNDETNVVMAAALPVSRFVRTCQGVQDLPAGTYTLRLRGDTQNLAQNVDVSVMVDDVRIVYEDSTCEERGLVTRITDDDGVWGAWTRSDASAVKVGNDFVTGAPEFQIPRGNWVRQNVVVPASGVYRVSLTLGGQQTVAAYTDGVNLGTSYYPVRFGVKVDGAVRGIYTFQDDELVTTRFALYLTEGEHAVQLETVTTGSAANGMVRVTDLDLVPLAVGAAPAKDVTKEARLALTGDARVELLYKGDLSVRAFSVNGKVYTGTLSRETSGLEAVLDGPGRIVVVPRGTILIFR